MPVRLRPLTNQPEAVVSDQLHAGLGETEWRVVPHVPIREIVRVIDERLTPPELRLVERGHFDFALYPSRQFDTPPAFVVEFDGPYHSDSEVTLRDIAKNRLCQRVSLPLLRLTTEDLTPLEERTVVAWIAERFAAHAREMPALQRRTRNELEELAAAGEDMDLVAESLNYDTSVIFDLDHPFSENAVIAKRLRDRFGIGTWCEGANGETELWLDDVAQSWGGEDGRVSEFVRYERRCAIRRGGQILQEFTAVARMAWAHKVSHSGPAGGNPPRTQDLWSAESVQWLMRRVDDLYCRYVPGADPHDITEAISLYDAMRQVERWAVARGLARLQS